MTEASIAHATRRAPPTPRLGAPLLRDTRLAALAPGNQPKALTAVDGAEADFAIGLANAQGRSLLIGGTASSTVAGMIKQLAGRAAPYSIGFEAESYDEMQYARITARHAGLKAFAADSLQSLAGRGSCSRGSSACC
jgi:hypothetical protein